jgi:hypothetical protein
MKYFLSFCILFTVLTSCKKTEEVQPQMQQSQPPPVDSTRMALEDAFKKIDKEKMKTHKGAIEVLANFPPGGPIPPHLLPAKNIKLLSANDTMATYTFTSGSTGMKGKAVLKKSLVRGDTMWIVVMAGQLTD